MYLELRSIVVGTKSGLQSWSFVHIAKVLFLRERDVDLHRALQQANCTLLVPGPFGAESVFFGNLFQNDLILLCQLVGSLMPHRCSSFASNVDDNFSFPHLHANRC